MLGFLRPLFRRLQFILGDKPVENSLGEDSDALRSVDYCGIVVVNEADFDPSLIPGLLNRPIDNGRGARAGGPEASGAFVQSDCGGVPTPLVPRIHDKRSKL